MIYKNWYPTLIFAFSIFSFHITSSQGFDRPPKYPETEGQADGEESPLDEFLQQVGVNVNSGSPRLNIKALKLYTKNKNVTLNLLSSLPTVSSKVTDSTLNLSNELQSLYGGLLNGYFSRTYKKEDEKEGFQFEWRFGYKLLNSNKDEGETAVFLNNLHAGIEFRYLIGLYGESDDPKKDGMKGMFQIKVSGLGSYSMNQDHYQYFFRLPDGSNPNKALFSANIEASLHVIEQFHISGGAFLSSVETVKNASYLKITYSKK